MRLHRLWMRAFGPFADDVTIDLDELGADGLFLLHGATGAGKTTVLDAVAFALFGRVPGARQEGRRLHSDHAPAEQVPEVELEATIGGRRLRIVRSPAHERPKKRGTGTTPVYAKATLEWVDGSGVTLTRLDEIGETVTELLGMSADQFFQVVLLPQGDFARFLRAPNDDREALLEKLFDTARFGDVEDWLRERARRSAEELDKKDAALDRLATQIAAVAGIEAPAEPDVPWAQSCLDAARDARLAAAGVLDSARTELDQALNAHQRGAARAADRRRGLDARTRLAQLDSSDAETEAARTALSAARRAAPIAPIADDHQRSEAALDRALRACADAGTELARHEEAASLREADDATLAAAIDGWSADHGKWEPLARRVAERPGIVADLAALEADIATADARLAELDAALGDAPARREAAERAQAAATEARASLPGLRARLERLDAVSTALTERDELIAQIDRAQRRLADAHEAHNAARERLLDLRDRRLTGMAAELAGKLVDGKPCAVCGSAEHPAPATGSGATVTDADEAAAAEIDKRAAGDRQSAQSTLDTYRERRAQRDTIVGDATAEQVAAEHRSVATTLGDAERLTEAMPELVQAVDDIDAQIRSWQQARSDIGAAQSARRERATTVRGTLDALDVEVAEATGGRGGVAQRRAELAELIRLGNALRDARREKALAGDRRDDGLRRLEKACTEAGFESSSAALEALATAAEIEAWESMLEQVASIRSAAEQTLAESDVIAALAAEPVDLDALAATREAAQQSCDTAAGTDAIAVQRVTQLEQHVAAFWAAFDAVVPVRARHAEVQGLAELVSGRGHNAKKMTLRSYVLAARLEEVLIAASARLRQMSAGRYEFAHSDAIGPRGRRGGLGIEVRDEYTGVTRAATTLSGGETFFASLALALGLADVVSAESGGRVLDTIFIDEGFGTLDPEALDLVMGVLDELRAGGRVVGVVSHVDELRARIPAQLEVLRGESGSTVRTLGAVGVS
ncbi:AAA family ATPase [Gordonia sp. NPDC003429]